MADNARRSIALRGVRVHNLKNVDLDLPHHALIVFTGVSGSGKSSLAFDTLYAEGRRRYIETFSPYTRQFLETLDKPDADQISGIPPAIAVSQRMSRRSGRSTVGTVTEIHDHLALLYARAGQVICPTCQTEVRPADTNQVVAAIEALPDRARYQVAFPLDRLPGTDPTPLLASIREDGFVRVRIAGQIIPLDDPALLWPETEPLDVIVDRLVRGTDDPGRRIDSIETAFARGLGRCRLITDAADRTFLRGWRCGTCGTDFLPPDPRLFRYSSPLGACPACEGFGRIVDLDLERIIPDPGKSLEQGAIAPWNTPAYRPYLNALIAAAPTHGIPTDRPFKYLDPAQVEMILDGASGFTGLRPFFKQLERKAYRMHIRVFLSRWRGYQPCPACEGARLRPEALAVRLGGMNLAEFSALTVADARAAIVQWAETRPDAVRLGVLDQVRRRLEVLGRIGLDYLTLDRLARTLSGGESRRVALTTALGSGLVNTLYVLDEPSIGLHPRDVDRLVGAVRDLRDAGNTVVVVEHQRALMEAADQLVDVGPAAGEAGGRILYQGPPAGVSDCEGSLTGDFLAGRRRFRVPVNRRPPIETRLEIRGARGNNLRDVNVSFPLGVFCVVTGVSGSGKSSLVEETLYPALTRRLGGEALPALAYRDLRGSSTLDAVVLVDQTPIGRTPRSNPVTYLKAFDEIRRTFAQTHEARLRNYSASTFSFNVEGGRCTTCEGNGHQIIDMQFLPDVMVRCPQCDGKRYRPEVLEVTYRGKTIAEVLDLTAREAFAYFRHRPKVQARLRPLIDVGLDYLRLGQPATTLSGGEAQRLKLAAHLGSGTSAINRAATSPHTLFILDEPTTGLHPADIHTLLDSLNRLVDLGNSLIVVEHDPDIMANADWIIDLGPEAGAGGGRIVAEGTPEAVAREETPTGRVLAGLLPPTPPT